MRNRGSHDDARPDVGLPDAPDLAVEGGRHDPAPRGSGGRGPHRVAMGQAPRPHRHRHGVERSEGSGRARSWLRARDPVRPRGCREARARDHERRRCGGRLRQRRQGHVRRVHRLAEAARAAGLRRHRVRSGAADRRDPARNQGLGLRDASGARGLHRRPVRKVRRSPGSCFRTLQPGGSGSKSTSDTSSRTPRRRIAISSRARRRGRRCSSSEEQAWDTRRHRQ